MNICVCIESNIDRRLFHRLSASDYNYKCNDNLDDIFAGDCGGESAYNLYETQGGTFFML